MMMNLTRSVILVVALSLVSTAFALGDEPSQVAQAIDRNTKAIQENTKQAKADANPSIPATVGKWTGQAVLSFAIWKVGEKLLTVLSKAGTSMVIMIPEKTFHELVHPGAAGPEARNVSETSDPKRVPSLDERSIDFISTPAAVAI